MHGVAPDVAQTRSEGDAVEATAIDANAVVAHNLRIIRTRKGWTQQDLAERLGELTGEVVRPSAISRLENTARPGRGCHRFDAHELYLLATAFDVPIVYFFLPPPGAELEPLADTGQPLAALYASFLGCPGQLEAVDERLRAARRGDAGDTCEVLARILRLSPLGPKGWQNQYYAWRADRLYQWTGDHGRHLRELAAYLDWLGRSVREAVPEAQLADIPPPPTSRSSSPRTAANR